MLEKDLHLRDGSKLNVEAPLMREEVFIEEKEHRSLGEKIKDALHIGHKKE